jgi:acetylornithine deacetylase
MNQRHAAPALSAVEMLARLISFDTTSRNSNLPLINFVRSWLDSHDVPYRLSFDPTGQKANLHAIIGPVEAGGIAFSGHVDTVSADGQTWTGDPFTLRQRDGRLIGRGTCDMKGFVAGMLAAVPHIKASEPTRPVHLFLTYDEEVGYHGARRLMEDLASSGLWPASCVVGEASGMLPILAQKGRFIARVGVLGHMAHSSEAHCGVNAVHAAAEAIAWLAAESRRLAIDGPTEDGFDPIYTLLQAGHFTCDSMPNTIPHRAGFDIEWRNIPATDPKLELARFQTHVATTIEPLMRSGHREAGFHYEILQNLAAVSMPLEHDLARVACEITGAKAGGKVSYCSEGSVFQPAGIDCMVCGPGYLPQVHRPDEWIDESQLVACEDFVRRVADRMAV